MIDIDKAIEELLGGGRIDAIEIEPLLGFDKDGNIVEDYNLAVGFEVTDQDDDFIIAWGVYAHREGLGVTNLFDVPTKDNAESAMMILERLMNLK